MHQYNTIFYYYNIYIYLQRGMRQLDDYGESMEQMNTRALRAKQMRVLRVGSCRGTYIHNIETVNEN